MTKIQRLLITKVFAVVLTILLLQGHTAWGCPADRDIKGTNDNFSAALEEYQRGLFEQAAAQLELLLNSEEADNPEFKAKVHLVLGACYEKAGKGDKAKEQYVALKSMLDEGSIDQIPPVAGVDTKMLNGYQEVFGEKSFFDYKKPIPVSEVMKKNVVHAPRKSIEEKEKEKKKKKFPWLIALSGAIITVAAAVLFLTRKPDKKNIFPDIVWVRIPAGEFLMGDNFNEGGTDELPVHKVYLDEYYISKYEMTRDHYRIFCEETGRGEALAGNFPAVGVSWHDARAFCNWLSQKTGKNINLPTEAQWEKAARGTNQYRYPWGNDEPRCDLANFYGCSAWGQNRIAELDPIGKCPKGKSPYGVYNMAGNVSEWCRDWYSSSYYSVSPEKNPIGPLSGSLRVVRGGNINTRAVEIRSANRDSKNPDYSDSLIGFRIVKEE